MSLLVCGFPYHSISNVQYRNKKDFFHLLKKLVSVFDLFMNLKYSIEKSFLKFLKKLFL